MKSSSLRPMTPSLLSKIHRVHNGKRHQTVSVPAWACILGRWPPGPPPWAVCFTDGRKSLFCLWQACLPAILLNFPFSAFVQKFKGSSELVGSSSYCTNKQNGKENFFQFNISLYIYLFLQRGRGASVVMKPSAWVLLAPAQACERYLNI